MPGWRWVPRWVVGDVLSVAARNEQAPGTADHEESNACSRVGVQQGPGDCGGLVLVAQGGSCGADADVVTAYELGDGAGVCGVGIGRCERCDVMSTA